jgi:hypothetical protein
LRGDTGVFTFSGQVRGVQLDAMNMVRVNEQGKIVEFTIFARPLPALATLSRRCRLESPLDDADAGGARWLLRLPRLWASPCGLPMFSCRGLSSGVSELLESALAADLIQHSRDMYGESRCRPGVFRCCERLTRGC